MANYKFTFTDDLDKKSIVIEAAYRGADLAKFVNKTVKANTERLNEFLSHFGKSYFEVENKETRRIMAKGNYTCNAFSGRSQVNFETYRYNLG